MRTGSDDDTGSNSSGSSDPAAPLGSTTKVTLTIDCMPSTAKASEPKEPLDAAPGRGEPDANPPVDHPADLPADPRSGLHLRRRWCLDGLPPADAHPHRPATRTLNVGIYSLSNGAPANVLLAAFTIASIPTLLIFLIFQRNIMADLTAGGLKG